jgi:hypothetical protein
MACRDNYLSLYTRAAAQFRDLALAHADGSVRNLLALSLASNLGPLVAVNFGPCVAACWTR